MKNRKPLHPLAKARIASKTPEKQKATGNPTKPIAPRKGAALEKHRKKIVEQAKAAQGEREAHAKATDARKAPSPKRYEAPTPPAKAPQSPPAKPAGKAPPAAPEPRKALPPAPPAPEVRSPQSEPASRIVDKTAPQSEVTHVKKAPEPGAMERVEWSGSRNGIKYIAGFDKNGYLIISCPKPFCVVSTVDVTIIPWRNEV